jgi:predicted Fe-S protein YdhL (DUF1289 family)
MTPTQELIAERAREVSAMQDTSAMLPSPCISVCRMDAASGLCEGCMRTLDEIAAWGMMDNRSKRMVWKEIELRALTPTLSRGEREKDRP